MKKTLAAIVFSAVVPFSAAQDRAIRGIARITVDGGSITIADRKFPYESVAIVTTLKFINEGEAYWNDGMPERPTYFFYSDWYSLEFECQTTNSVSRGKIASERVTVPMLLVSGVHYIATLKGYNGCNVQVKPKDAP